MNTAGPEAALSLIEPLEELLGGYFYYFGVMGAQMMRLGRTDEARTAFDRAVGLAASAAEAAHIRNLFDRISKDAAPE